MSKPKVDKKGEKSITVDKKRSLPPKPVIDVNIEKVKRCVLKNLA